MTTKEARDPICGMMVRTDRAAFTLEHNGRTIYFCSAACRKTYAQRNGLSAP